MAERLCSIAGCSTTTTLKSWCRRHYGIWRRFGDPEAPTRRYEAQIDQCSVDACERSPQGRGMCLMHWKRWKRHGTPTPRMRGQVVDGKRICATCQRDMPAEAFRYSKCGECWPELNRRRQAERRAGSAVERFTRLEVLERDGYVCGICGGAIDATLAWPHPLSPSLDHVIPLSRGGEHSMANAQAAHLTCNLRKWAKTPAEMLAVNHA